MQRGSDPLPDGVIVARTDLGGVGVEWNGNLIGWLHASIGDKWNAYVCDGGAVEIGRLVGRFTKEEAVWRIALEAGWSKI